MVFGKDFIDRIDEWSGMGFYDEEFIPEEDVVTCGPEPFGVEIAQGY